MNGYPKLPPGTDLDRIDTSPRVLTRRRIEQLRSVGLFTNQTLARSFQHFGPLAPLDRLLNENAPVHPDMLADDGWLPGDEDSQWGVVLVFVEPDWHIAERQGGYWVVWEDWGHPWDGGDLHNQWWETEELARRYLELLTDNFWAKVRR